ncbi:hypothetical protein C6P42_002800 [Pichia californica]|nr:hypothetical protein C6P42_002800 [[Candida] californica]
MITNNKMSLVQGYSSDSESENDSVGKISDIILPSLPHATSNEITKTVSGKFQKEFIDPLRFEKNKRIHKDFLIGNEEDGITELKKRKIYESQKATKAKSKVLNIQKSKKGDPSKFDDDFNGYKGSWGSSSSSSSPEHDSNETNDNEEIIEGTPIINGIETENFDFKESSNYYGNKSKNYSIFDLPKDYQIRFATTIAGQKEYFVPKKLLSSYKAHESAVTSLQFLPNSGHLLLSSGNDCMVKLWSVTKPKTLIRDYHCHTRAVKHCSFNNDGHQFVSCSYDRTVKIWDTEIGEVSYKKRLNSNPNMATFVPNKPDEIMVALQSAKVEHLDSRTGETIQTYEHHQSAITWIEFLNNGNQFITASDDRTLKIWDIRINMPIKYIQDPKQQAMPIVKKHPTLPFFVGQSMDNQILVYSCKKGDKFKKNNQKSFSGHNNAAYAIGMGFTPDGKTIFSGDSNGFCYFWDWKTSKIVRKIKISDKVISCVDMHPLETSLVSMAGFDGNIYIYT